MSKNLFRKLTTFFIFLFIFFSISLLLPKTVKAQFNCDFTWLPEEYCDWQNQGCGDYPCKDTEMHQTARCYTCWLGLVTGINSKTRCVTDSSCQTVTPTPTPISFPKCDGVYDSGYCCPYTWISGSCGGGSCTSKQRYQYQWCTSLSGSGTWKHEQCVSDTSCGGSGGTTTICGDIGGDKCIHDSSGCPAGYTSLGQTSDCVSCCKSSSEGSTGGGCTLGEWSASRCATCKSNRTWNANCTDYGSASTWCACASWCDPAAYAANTACGGSPIPGGFTCP